MPECETVVTNLRLPDGRSGMHLAIAGGRIAAIGAGPAPEAATVLGNDNMRDTWGPYGTDAMLERAAIIGWRSDWRSDALLRALFGMVAGESARWMGIAGHGLAPGAAANLFTLPAENIPEAIAQHPPRRLVVFQGRMVARDGVVLA